METTIGKAAGGRWRLGWDESVNPSKPPRTFDKREMYRTIEARPGDIYKYDDNTLAWYCPSRKKGLHALKTLPEWFTVQVECHAEWIFNFPLERLDEVAQVARPYRSRKPSP